MQKWSELTARSPSCIPRKTERSLWVERPGRIAASAGRRLSPDQLGALSLVDTLCVKEFDLLDADQL